jgi:hypothetical protein
MFSFIDLPYGMYIVFYIESIATCCKEKDYNQAKIAIICNYLDYDNII